MHSAILKPAEAAHVAREEKSGGKIGTVPFSGDWKAQEIGPSHLFIHLFIRGEVEYKGKKATIRINRKSCVGVTMCAFNCPVDIFEPVNDKSHMVLENLPKCLLQDCMKCRDNCPTHFIWISVHD